MTVLAIFVLLLFSIRLNRNWINPTTLMCGLWFAILLTYEMNIIPLNKIHSHTYIVIIMGLLSFAIGSGVSSRTKISFIRKETITTKWKYVPNYRMILGLAVLSLAMQLPDAINAVTILMGGGDFVLLRSMVSKTVISNSLLNAVQNYILNPFVIFLYPIAAYCLLTLKNDAQNRSQKKWIFILAAIIAVLKMFTSGGRTSPVYLVVHIVILMKLMSKKIYIPRTIKRIIVIAIITVAVGVYYVSVSRGIDDVSESIVLYFNGCVPLLDHYITAIIETNSYTYGGAFFFGPIQLIFTLLGNVGFPEPSFLKELSTMLYVENNVSVGFTYKMNAFVSWFFYLFKDGGYFALAIGSSIYGAISQSFYKKAIADIDNTRKIIGYSIITNTILFSMVRYQFVSYYYLLAFVFLWLLIKRRSAE